MRPGWLLPTHGRCRKSFQDLKEPSSLAPVALAGPCLIAASPFKISKNLPEIPRHDGPLPHFLGPQVLSRSQRTFQLAGHGDVSAPVMPQVLSRSQRTFQRRRQSSPRSSRRRRKFFQDLKEPSSPMTWPWCCGSASRKSFQDLKEPSRVPDLSRTPGPVFGTLRERQGALALLSHCVCAWRKRKDNPCLNLHLARGIPSRRKSFQDLKEPSSSRSSLEHRSFRRWPQVLSRSQRTFQPADMGFNPLLTTSPQVLSRSQRTFQPPSRLRRHASPGAASPFKISKNLPAA